MDGPEMSRFIPLALTSGHCGQIAETVEQALKVAAAD